MHHARSDPATLESNPWLAVGERHLDVEQAFVADYGHAPQDDDVLKGWWQFRREARTVGLDQPARQLVTEKRLQTEVR